jgi:hypothetical protein
VEKLRYGVGKGSCSSPMLWALLNQLILTALEDKYNFITLVSVDTSITVKRSGGYFVDDTTMGATDDNITKEPIPIGENELTEDEEAMVKRMEDIIQFFLDLLQVTGGDLSPEKCVWYLIAHRWSKGVLTLLTKKHLIEEVLFNRDKIISQEEGGDTSVNPSGKTGTQIPQLPLGDNSSPWGDNAVCT